MLVVTTDSIPGYEVRAVIGEVVGVTVRSWNPWVEGVKSLNGRTNPRLVRLMQQIRQEAIAHMVELAEDFGANAVLGMRFDHRGVTNAWNEICAYGTAVLVVAANQLEIPAAASAAMTVP
jgi:uncharacterized protein YbjQ (UPF0145 family)